MNKIVAEINSIISSNPKQYVIMVKNREHLWSWVQQNCDPNCIEASTKIFTALHPNERVLCPCNSGKLRKLKSITAGFRFCGHAGTCTAATAAVSKNCIKAAKNWDKQSANKRRVATNLQKYGVSNTGQTSSAKKKHKEFYEDQNNIARVTAKTSGTYLARTGYANPQQNPCIIKKTAKTLLEKYGVTNIHQIHIGSENMAILNDPTQMAELLNNCSIDDICLTLNVTANTIIKYHDIHDLGLINISKSLFEDEVELFLKKNNIAYSKNNRKLLNGKEIDFVLIDFNLAIECNGLYWHGERCRPDKNYHRDKTDACQSAGLQLLTVFQDEWISSKHIIKNHILHLCRKTTTIIGARKIEIRELDDVELCKKFLINYHIQGNVIGNNIILGGWYDGNLIAVITVKKTNDFEYDITRFATDFKASYPGLFSKFLSSLKKLGIEKVTTIADRRWSLGNLYIQSGFTIDNSIGPDYFYTNYKRRWHKTNFRKEKIARKFNVDIENKTEKQLMRELGFDRVWDCGKIKFSKKL